MSVLWKSRGVMFGLALAAVMAPALLFAQDPPGPVVNRCGEIHSEIVRQNLPIKAVRGHASGRYELLFPEGCSAQDMQAAQAAMEAVLSGKGVIEVQNLQDAMVVLRFEPDNRSALALVKQRYDRLKSQAQGQ